jgi:hypothetical protein
MMSKAFRPGVFTPLLYASYPAAVDYRRILAVAPCLALADFTGPVVKVSDFADFLQSPPCSVR